MNGPEHDVAVVVCTHRADRVPMLLDCLASLRSQTRRPERVLVVVDGTEELAREVRRQVEGTEVVAVGSNQGVCAARNLGAEVVTEEIVVFLDDDAVSDPTWLEQLLLPLSDPSVIGVSGRSEAVFEGTRAPWLPDEFLWAVGCSYRGMPQEPTRVRNVYGGCSALRRDVFLAVGGYPVDVGHSSTNLGGGEEVEMCLAASAAVGGTFFYTPHAVIRHRVPASRMTWSFFLRRCLHEGRSKAVVAARVDAALTSERAFGARVPLAVARTLVTRGERLRALGLVLGSVAVLLGLVRGRVAAAGADR